MSGSWFCIAMLTSIVCILPANAAMTTVPSGGNLQAALNAAKPGDVIVLQAGATFTGNFTVARNSGPTITIQSSALAFMPAGTRVTPAQAQWMPKLVTPNANPVLRFESGMNHYVLFGIEFYSAKGVYVQDLIRLGLGTENDVALLPYDLFFGRCYIHGDLVGGAGGKRGIAMNSGATTVSNSYIEGFVSTFQDTQAIAGWNGPGPYSITRNYLSAGTETVAFGGAPVAIRGQHPSNITVQGNYFVKHAAWFTDNRYWVKNHLELKDAQHVLIDCNVFDYTWSEVGRSSDPWPQRGFALVFTVRANSDAEPWATVSDVRVTNNVIRHAGGGINFTGHDDDGSGTSGQFVIKDNLWEDIGGQWGPGHLFQILSGVNGLSIQHNTAFQNGFIMLFDVTPSINVSFTDNIVNAGQGIAGNGTAVGTGTLNRWAQGWLCTQNVFIGSNAAQYPVGNYFPGNITAVQFVNPTGQDYGLQATSPFHGLASDLTDIGGIQPVLSSVISAAGAQPVN